MLGCRAPGGDDAGTPLSRVGDGGVVDVELGFSADAGLGVFGASATVFHWSTAWNEASVQPLARPMIDRYLATRLGTVLLEHAWPAADATTPPDSPTQAAFYQALYGRVLDDVLGHDGTVLLQLAGPPRWASSSNQTDPIVPGQNNRPIWSVAPPSAADGYATWKSAVAGLTRWVQHTHPVELQNGRVLLAYAAELNNEEFFGDLALYAPAWEAFAEAVRGVEAGARVGGGGKLDGVTPKSKPVANQTREPVLATWLAGCRALSCRIDFVVGHNFTMNPIRWSDAPGEPKDDFAALVEELERVMSPYGYSHLPLFLTDWTSWEFKDQTRHPWLSSEHDTEYRAAHLAASLGAMANAGYSGQTQGALFETVTSITDEFSGDWGLFSKRGITKASFHATALASRLSGTPFSVTTGDRFISGAGAASGPTKRVLLTRFVPDTEHGAKLLVASLGARLAAQGYDEARLSELGCAVPALQRLATTLTREPCALAQAPLATTLDAWFDLLHAAQLEPEVRTARLRIPWGAPTARVHLARVDAAHSNPGPACKPNACLDIAETNAGVGALSETSLTATADGGVVELDVECRLRQVVLVTVEP